METHSILENPRDRKDWWATVQRVTKIRTQLSMHTHRKVKVAQSCLTLCKPTDYTVYGILQARILEWVAYPFSSGSSCINFLSLLKNYYYKLYVLKQCRFVIL